MVIVSIKLPQQLFKQIFKVLFKDPIDWFIVHPNYFQTTISLLWIMRINGMQIIYFSIAVEFQFCNLVITVLLRKLFFSILMN